MLERKLGNQNDKYKQALDEIEKIVKDLGCYTSYQEWKCKQILDIISKAKEEENAR